MDCGYANKIINFIGGRGLKRAGADGIIVEDKANKPVYIIIDNGEVSIEDASDLGGKKTSVVEEELRSTFKNARVATICPTGENLSYIANIMSETRTAGTPGS
jgi:aldehyde:ferredoxin oxidoreductase